MKIRKGRFYTHDSTDLIVHILNVGFYDSHVKYKGALYAKPNGYFIEICRFEKPDTTGWQAYTTLEDALRTSLSCQTVAITELEDPQTSHHCSDLPCPS